MTQTRGEFNSDPLEEESQPEPSRTGFPSERSPVEPMEDQTSMSSFTCVNNMISINSILAMDNQESNSMSFGLPDSILTAEDVYKEEYDVVQDLVNTTGMSQLIEQGNEATAPPASPTDNEKGSDTLEEVIVYADDVIPPLASNQEITQQYTDPNISIDKSESSETQPSVFHPSDRIDPTDAIGPAMASQPLLGPEVKLKEEIPGDTPNPNDIIKVEAGLMMTWDEFERIAEQSLF